MINGIEYTYVSNDEATDFTCARCKKHKKSKKYAQFKENGATKKICNGCYGFICAERKK